MFSRRRSAPLTQNTPDNTPNTPVNWRRLLGYLGPYKLRMVLAIVALVASSLIGLLFPLIIVQLLNTVLKQHDLTQLNGLTAALVGLFFVSAAFNFFQSYSLTYIGERIILDLRTSLYRHLQALSLDFYANRRVGEIVSRLSSDVTQVRSVLTNNITQLLGSTMSLVGFFPMFSFPNPRLFGFGVVRALVIVVVAVLFWRSLQGLSTNVQDEITGA